MADIVDTAIGAGFKTLAKALQAAELVHTLKEHGPYTVFAPTDEAFSRLPAGKLETLLAPENKETLSQLLLHHVVRGVLRSTDLTTGDIQSLVSSDLHVTVSSGVVVNDAKVVQADVQADNGIIHAIDRVLLYPN
ncbi:fasciclin domain-containing protein [Gloeobacter kilaueensis]|uniref:Beta-Ig-H3/fasciclin n=1 Tax=Gloeobacter kilaueensis (strain ATCC BAA-2537 / CCAP 1431/1 / ULC 316 / JS1) TaxID=1183438 RepID=U5QLF8_GLOK1|nr:fasciclin domain-containing protein [Gloeobacter kilaueensis]AGY58429.1 beta-Ig-H3/fasciclin [Gloeobacter kilaueensis JS1]